MGYGRVYMVYISVDVVYGTVGVVVYGSVVMYGIFYVVMYSSDGVVYDRADVVLV